jgi:alpha-amylase/alpha-mannosidase (GH57 family)
VTHARGIIVHGHFYQPPRENPWTGRIERQPSAAPLHDWNERIHAECYRANAFARIHGAQGRIRRVVNNYALLSFNFGPTLLSWIQAHDPITYGRILEADRDSARRLGAGNALAQAYNHMILPLANARDRRTQIRWGIADFRRRFGRRPEGMWLPETGADLPTLEALAAEGIRFTILAPWQARGPIDPGRPYRVACPGGRELIVFFYDADISRDLGFGTLAKDGRALAQRLGAGPKPLTIVATDGETFGHHKSFADLSLAWALSEGVGPVNFGHVLATAPPMQTVEIVGPSSWSCAHGVERWNSDCGCRVALERSWSQAWRRPLRAALDALRDRLADLFEREGGRVLRDPWAARDAFIGVVLDRSRARAFLRRHGRRDPVRALELLEMQHQAMLMYTSCGWFFDDLAGIETVQILRHAARAIELARARGLERFFTGLLAGAVSNRPERGDGRMIYRAMLEEDRVDPPRAVAHALLGGRSQTPAYRVDRAGRGARWRSKLTGQTRRLDAAVARGSCRVAGRRFSRADLPAEDLEAILRRELEPLAREAQEAGLSWGTLVEPESDRRLLPALRRWMRRPGPEPLARLRELAAGSPPDLWEAQTLFHLWIMREQRPARRAQATAVAAALGFE